MNLGSARGSAVQNVLCAKRGLPPSGTPFGVRIFLRAYPGVALEAPPQATFLGPSGAPGARTAPQGVPMGRLNYLGRTPIAHLRRRRASNPSRPTLPRASTAGSGITTTNALRFSM